MRFTIGGESYEMKMDSWQRSNMSPSIELMVERKMTDIEAKALALVNEVAAERGTEYPCVDRRNDARWEALCRAIEQHEAFQQEVERLNGLITATADHWLTLQVKHPIQWEGAINGAMAAACAEIEKHEAFRQEVSDAVAEYKADQPYVWKQSASDYFCRFIIPKPKPDPLVEVLNEALGRSQDYEDYDAKEIRAALDAAGFEIKEKNDD